MRHWQDAVNAALGAWLIATPWVLGFSDNGAATLGMIVLGIALIAVAAGAMILPQAWEEWTEVVLGVLAGVAPWVLGFASMEIARSWVVLTGVAVIALACWTLATDPDYKGRWWKAGVH